MLASIKSVLKSSFKQSVNRVVIIRLTAVLLEDIGLIILEIK
jgi:hypothetical protein